MPDPDATRLKDASSSRGGAGDVDEDRARRWAAQLVGNVNSVEVQARQFAAKRA